MLGDKDYNPRTVCGQGALGMGKEGGQADPWVLLFSQKALNLVRSCHRKQGGGWRRLSSCGHILSPKEPRWALGPYVMAPSSGGSDVIGLSEYCILIYNTHTPHTYIQLRIKAFLFEKR